MHPTFPRESDLRDLEIRFCCCLSRTPPLCSHPTFSTCAWRARPPAHPHAGAARQRQPSRSTLHERSTPDLIGVGPWSVGGMGLMSVAKPMMTEARLHSFQTSHNFRKPPLRTSGYPGHPPGTVPGTRKCRISPDCGYLLNMVVTQPLWLRHAMSAAP